MRHRSTPTSRLFRPGPVWVGLALTVSALAGFMVLTVGGSASADHTDLIAAKIQVSEDTLALEPLASGLGVPVLGATAPYRTNQLFVVSTGGKVTVLALDGTSEPYTFLDVGPDGTDQLVQLKTQGFDERGLLGLAFHPHYPKNGLLYTYVSEPLGPIPDFTTLDENDPRRDDTSLSVIREWRVDDPRRTRAVVNPASSRVVMSIEQPQGNHNAGEIVFGPDAMLYIALGDGGGSDDEGDGHGPAGVGNGQDLGEGNVLGKILRIDPTGSSSANGQYGVPADNPFVDAPGADEAFAHGFRNPFRISFDHSTGDLLAADVGQRDIEEVNRVVAGGNYGWPVKEGTFLFNQNGEGERGFAGEDSPGSPVDMIDPIAQYDHDEGTSITGGFVYRGNELEAMRGSYIFGDLTAEGDLVAGRFFRLTPDGELLEILPTNHDDNRLLITGFGRDTQGELYVFGLQPNGQGQNGVAYKLVAAN